MQSLIHGHSLTLKALLKEHNNRNLMSPIRLDFSDEVQGNEKKELRHNLRNNNANDGLRKPFKEALKSPFTRRIIEFSAPKHEMPTNVKIYERSTNLENFEEWHVPNSLTLKRTGPVIEEPSSKRLKSTEAPIPSVPDVPPSPVVSSPPSLGTRKKSLTRKRLPKPKSTFQELNLDADAQTFIKVVSSEESDDEAPPVWSALVGWEVIPTPPTTSNLEAVKKIFKYLKGQPKLGLWYPKESHLVLEAYSDSDYAGANKDRKSTTSGCQFLGRRLISWQCKKQTIVATSSTEVEYVAATNCCGQKLGTISPMVRQKAELQRRRQQEVLDSAMYYNEANWINIRAQVEANASLSKTLLGDDVSEDNFPARMAALIKRKRQPLAEKLAQARQNWPMTQAQQRTYMRQYV
nr:putative ribonuclease H-like domain-containing protein [Tanacetum cinerariifolium]